MQTNIGASARQAYAQGVEEYDELMRLPTFRDFVVLYIAEGYKRTRNSVSICNSDPVIALARAGCASLSGRRCGSRSNITRTRMWRTTWLLGACPRSRRGGGQCYPKSPTAVSSRAAVALRARRRPVEVHDTFLRARLQAWIDRIRQDWDLHSPLAFGA